MAMPKMHLMITIEDENLNKKQKRDKLFGLSLLLFVHPQRVEPILIINMLRRNLILIGIGIKTGSAPFS